MTGQILIESLISVASIALMVGVAWLFFRAPAPAVTKELARERLAFDEPDFKPVRWLMDQDGHAALAEGEDGDVALVSRLGLDLVTRRYPPSAVRVEMSDESIIIRPSDPGSRSIKIATAEVAGWAGKFAQVRA